MVNETAMQLIEANVPKLQQIFDRLKEEHSALRKELDHVQEMANHMVCMQGSEESERILQDIRTEMAMFLQQLGDHEHWEEAEVLPVLGAYANQNIEPTFLTSTWVLEEGHKEAERFVLSFLTYAEQCKALDSAKLKKVISLLCVACAVSTEHLLSEEEMVFPVADQMLSDFKKVAL